MEVKPWDDETDMKALEDAVRSIEMAGLVWGASKLVAIGYGIKKLQITLVVGAFFSSSCSVGLGGADDGVVVWAEDELVSLEDLQDKLAEFEDFVQSSDISAMQSACCYLLPVSLADPVHPRRIVIVIAPASARVYPRRDQYVVKDMSLYAYMYSNPISSLRSRSKYYTCQCRVNVPNIQFCILSA